MDYELSVLDEVVFGALSPRVNVQQDSAKQIEYLEKHFGKCSLIMIAEVLIQDERLVVLESKQICNFHPAIQKMISKGKLQLNKSTTGLDTDLIEILNIQTDQITGTFIEQKDEKTVLYIQSDFNWEDLNTCNIKYYFYCGLLTVEKKRLIQKIKSVVHSSGSIEQIKNYIHKNQQALIALCFNIMNQIDGKKNITKCPIRNAYSDKDIYCMIYNYLERLLRFIEIHFIDYIDKNVKIPVQSALLKQFKINKKLEFVQVKLREANITPELNSIVFTPIYKLENLSFKNRITYRELIYYNAYLNQLTKICRAFDSIEDRHLLGVLFQVNYNATVVKDFITRQMESELLEIENVKQQLATLYRMVKENNQKCSYPNLALNPKSPSLKTKLGEWLEDEIQFRTRSIQLLCEDQPVYSKSIEKKNVKIETGLTVAEIALFHRVMMDANLLVHTNQTELFNFISESYKSKRTNSISADSIKSKYYSPEENTIQAVKAHLRNMMIVLNELE